MFAAFATFSLSTPFPIMAGIMACTMVDGNKNQSVSVIQKRSVCRNRELGNGAQADVMRVVPIVSSVEGLNRAVPRTEASAVPWTSAFRGCQSDMLAGATRECSPRTTTTKQLARPNCIPSARLARAANQVKNGLMSEPVFRFNQPALVSSHTPHVFRYKISVSHPMHP